ncbi:MAG: DUF1294 domain-containing protein [Nitrososphaerales archaeon]|nr:DUF1294 domain-containing protein [Nitrososphaerales archaeon]
MLPIQISPVWLFIIGWIFFLGFAGFTIMGIDKSRARYGEWRVPERTLFMIAVAGGAFGVVAGSAVFHHKTLKDSFAEVNYVAAIAWLVILLELQKLLGPPVGLS